MNSSEPDPSCPTRHNVRARASAQVGTHHGCCPHRTCNIFSPSQARYLAQEGTESYAAATMWWRVLPQLQEGLARYPSTRRGQAPSSAATAVERGCKEPWPD